MKKSNLNENGRSLLPESDADAPTVLSAVYTNSTPAKNRQADVPQYYNKELRPECEANTQLFSSDVYGKRYMSEKITSRCPQYGRSMIEMLGVLAIIGVLSVGGITGYSKAMLRYKVNKSIEQVSLISQNVRSFFASQRNYGGLDSPNHGDTNGLSLIKKAKLVPEEMIDENNSIDDGDMALTHHIFNAFGGGVVLWEDNEGTRVEDCKGNENCKYFQIIFFNLPQDACIELAIQDWRSSAMGLHQIGVYNFAAIDLAGEYVSCINRPTGTIEDDHIIACPNGTTAPIPVPLDIAVNACNCPDNDCTIMWEFK